MDGLHAVCQHLFAQGFHYVLLGDIQSDRIEGEFSFYRHSTGSNSFMTSADAVCAYKKLLARFSATFLEEVNSVPPPHHHHLCTGLTYSIAQAAEDPSADWSSFEKYSSAHVTGWLEFKCEDLHFSEEDSQMTSSIKEFIEEVSRGKLKVPHLCTYQVVQAGLGLVKKVQKELCCKQQLVQALELMNEFYSFGTFTPEFFRRLANVLLNGSHKLEKDTQNTLYQTSIKKARLA